MKRNLFFIAAVFVAVIGILLLGNIITIGDKIGELTHVYVEYAFYAIIVILFLIYVIRPVVKVHRSPEFPVLTVRDDWDTRKLANFAKKLAKINKKGKLPLFTRITLSARFSSPTGSLKGPRGKR